VLGAFRGEAKAVNRSSLLPQVAVVVDTTSDNLDLSKWARKKKRLNQRVQALQLKIQETRETLESETAEKAIETLRAKVHSLQVRVMELLLEMDELNKAKSEIETREVLTAYLAYRNLH
jgi:predicted  nucleic acid-binding Zn-ribbon protein